MFRNPAVMVSNVLHSYVDYLWVLAFSASFWWNAWEIHFGLLSFLALLCVWQCPRRTFSCVGFVVGWAGAGPPWCLSAFHPARSGCDPCNKKSDWFMTRQSGLSKASIKVKRSLFCQPVFYYLVMHFIFIYLFGGKGLLFRFKLCPLLKDKAEKLEPLDLASSRSPKELGGGYLGGVLVWATKDSGTSTAISRVSFSNSMRILAKWADS